VSEKQAMKHFFPDFKKSEGEVIASWGAPKLLVRSLRYKAVGHFSALFRAERVII